MKNTLRLALAVSAFASVSAFATDITGAGATFPYPLYAKWAATYQTETGSKMNYQSIGSGGGIKQITAKTVDFGASDMPLKPEDLAKTGLTQFPTVIGGVVPVVNIPGVKAGQMKFTGPLLADIYLGKVKTWNDPAIAKLNPGVKLPKDTIFPVRRADGSGTTFIFTNYLSKVSPEWASKVGSNTSVNWPTGQGGKGNEGVANFVNRIKGSIGYVEYIYAKQNNMAFGQMKNADGKFVTPSQESFKAAAGHADWKKAPGYYLLLTNQSGADTWPIAGATFILMHKKQDKPVQATAALKFFDWAYKSGDGAAASMDYIPLPESVKGMIRDSWKQITDAKGQPVWK
ncbi:MAG: phosphate ABC transporter substrate-binding protein PstS [Paludibacterium sp.]|uniref:phosphate ABC transporter substrate-binding protein PstS n=1 Tax=Paludibacterium sp. TaxID=1917523 RepID=UPI0025DFBC5D|nr:phosphate ABC transporter substrate-binding protein PstS [Paludibacterium sp.]MBV8048624.1 phosphate ABC transporter substrate-binding protein PstS [Paludibacterium sp.]